MANPITRNLDLDDLELLGHLLVRRLGLSNERLQVLQNLIDNGDIDATTLFEITRLQFTGGKNIAPVDRGDLEIALQANAEAGLHLGFYPEGADVVLSGFTLPKLHRAQRSFQVPSGQMTCGFELSGTVGGGVQSQPLPDWQLSLAANGSLETHLRFFKTLPQQGSREALLKTLKAFTTPFNILSEPPDEGEVVVAEFRGLLQLGANFDYGWSASGTRKLGTSLDNLDLAVETKVDAQLGASAHFRLEDQVALIVQSLETDSWVNVSFMKTNDRDAGLALNFDVDASLHTLSNGREDLGPFVDSLLSRTRLPSLMADLRPFDTPEEVREYLHGHADELVTKLTNAVRDALEGPAERLDSLLEPVRIQARELLAAYQALDADVRSFFENTLEKVPTLQQVDDALHKIANAESMEDLLELLSDEAEDLRLALSFLSRALDLDLSQVSWLKDHLPDLRALAQKILGVEGDLRTRFENAYSWFKKQLYVEEVVQALETLDQASVQSLLDEKILWLETYLSERLGQPIDQLVNHLDPAIRVLGKIVSGYDAIVEKAKKALTTTLNQEIGLQASLAWQSVSVHQTLASVDLDLSKEAGQEAMRSLMGGDIHRVMQHQLTHADAIRFQKSYFLDTLSRSLSLRVVINGRQDLRVDTALVSRQVTIEPTANGEIWAQESTAQTTWERTNRRAMININTLFQVSLQDLFLRHGAELQNEETKIGQYDISYTLEKTIQQADPRNRNPVTAELVIDQLDHILGGIAFEVIHPSALQDLREDLRTIGQLGTLPGTSLILRVYLSPSALYQIFTDGTSETMVGDVETAWDDAVHSTFENKLELLAFYDRHKTDRQGVPPWGTVKTAALTRIEWNDAFHVINSRGTFTRILRDLRHNVFQALSTGDRLEPTLKARLKKKLDKGMKRLAEKMRWVNGIEHGNNQRDFIMTVFANLADASDRSSSLVVSYTHPVSQQRMNLRVDEEPPRLDS